MKVFPGMRDPAMREQLKAHRLSSVLSEMANDRTRETISISDIVTHMGERAFGALLLVFALPNLIPHGIPGVSAVLGLPMLFIAWPMMLGKDKLWLPEWLRTRAVKRTDFARIVNKVIPWLKRIEKMLRPRLPIMELPLAEQFIGLGILILAVLLILPIPFGNFLPALAISILALSIIARDGIALIVGVATGIGSGIYVSGLVYGTIKSVGFLLAKIFS